MMGAGKISGLQIPDSLKTRGRSRTSPVYFIDARDGKLDLADPDVQDGVNRKIMRVLGELFTGEMPPPARVKIHPGEPRARTGLIPRLTASQLSFLRGKGLRPVIGDSTVIYTGGRGCASNPPEDVSAYMKIVEGNRWGEKDTGAPFVVIDRPASSVPGVFEFEEEEIFKEVDSPGAYAGVFVSGGMERAKTVFNNAHLTMHGLSPIALCVKGLAMGGGSSRGKKQMHMNLYPVINAETCKACGVCAANCPSGALRADKGEVPELLQGCSGCGECMAVCPHSAITIEHEGSVEWGKGTDSFLSRLADFTVSMMNGKWGGLLNIGHLYQITAQCDCMNAAQKPIMGDIGIIISRNPFAADRCAAELFCRQARRENKDYPLDNYRESFRYVEETYRIRVEPEIIEV